MSTFCETCGRGAQSAQKRSHSNIATKTRQRLNLQIRRFGGITYRLCARCLRSLNKNPRLLEQAGEVERRLTSRVKRAA